ncbi:MAG: aldehyde ferredoxin oxidoreductase family protein [Pirellulaceae bacterium]|nr:aldehyde ferredoxin oxidoreductase family protein [Pirellulaceae bacterium]
MAIAITTEQLAGPTAGYHGRYLRIDVTAGSAGDIPIPEAVLRQFLGGSGLGTWLLLREGAASALPLAPDSSLAIVFSPLVGSPLTTSAKFAVVSKSPLTGRINDSLASSALALAGKRAGGDAILITGQAERLSVLIVDHGQARLESAADLAGLACGETERRLKQRFGADYSFAVIGPAGERLVRYATISHDGRHAGRGGSGAVLGAKRIKAIAVRGSARVSFAQPAKLAAYAKELSARSFGPATAKYRELGTAANLLAFNRLGTLPTRNFQAGSFAEAEQLAPETLSLVREKTRASCAACTIGCEHIYALRPAEVELASGKVPGGVRLEYENLFALGPLCGVGDSETVLRASRRCDELGLDTISAGGTIAFAMECAERGLIDAPWLRFGDGQALLRAVELIGCREGLGDLLAEGSRRVAEAIGQGSLDFAPQVKGLEIPGYEPRALQTMALGFAVGTRGADHNRSGAYEVDFSERADRRQLTPESACLAVETEDKAALMDSLILCKFLRGVFADFQAEAAEMLRLVTGWDVTADELRLVAQRVVAAKKLFNIRAGWQPEEDVLPPRLLSQALPGDPAARLSAEQLAAAVRAYNLARGWSAAGWVPAEELARLGLAEL